MSEIKQELILGPYKEPLEAVKDGYGFMGAISLTVEGKVQCHICGGTFDNLGKHLYHSHKIKTAEYRERFGLSKGTKLVSEAERVRMKEVKMRWWHSLTYEQQRAYVVRCQKGRAAFLSKIGKEAYAKQREINLEQKNKRGICPEQLLKLIRDSAKELKAVPTMDEFERYYGTGRFFRPIIKTFGSWNEAIKKAGLIPHAKYGTNSGPKKLYETDELLEYLSDFYYREGSLPTPSDFSRGFLPAYNTYLERFGSLIEARRRAGLPEPNTRRGGWHSKKKTLPTQNTH